ncbi:MAG: dihydrodipicolinate synthase family protein [Limnochordia bacterium]|nr:dihydrodipicolinate synthase family protein [Limnochordia bacterium]MDD4518536.1 dihydrodipicolinate synthase family protein [Limnochordia bacterium]
MGIKGVIPPLVTPLDLDGKLDVASLQSLIQRLIQDGVDGLFLAGSTGEGANLTDGVYFPLVEKSLACCNNLPVYVGISENGTGKVKEKIDQLSAFSINGVVITAPAYFNYSSLGLSGFFTEIADYSPFPVIVYNIPSNNHVYLTPELLKDVSQHDNIHAVKDSAGRYIDFQRLLFLKQEGAFKANLLQGCEELMMVSALSGADGIIPGIANIAAKECVGIWQAAQKGDVKGGYSIQKRVLDLMRIYERGPWISALKSYLSNEGVCKNYVTAPFGFDDNSGPQCSNTTT